MPQRLFWTNVPRQRNCAPHPPTPPPTSPFSHPFRARASYVSQRGNHRQGIMFDIEVTTGLPLAYLKIDSIWVRGYLGPVTVYVTKQPGSGYADNCEPR